MKKLSKLIAREENFVQNY